MIKGIIRKSLRIDSNLNTRIELLSLKNGVSFNKMVIYLIELGYNSYLKRFDKYYESQNDILEEGNIIHEEH